MEYVIEKNGDAQIGPSLWNSHGLKEAAGLRGNAFPPTVPHSLNGGRTLRAVEYETLGTFQEYGDGELSGDVWFIPAVDMSPEDAAEKASSLVPKEISKHQLIIQSAKDGWITENQAIAWSTSNTLPQLLEDAINSLPTEQRFSARIKALEIIGARIDDPLMLAVAAAAETDQAALETFFTEAAAL